MLSMIWTISRRVSTVLVALAVLAPIPAKAEAVSDWNLIATKVFTNAARSGAAAAIDFAYMNAAIYDAVNAIDGRYSVYAVMPSTSPVGASQEAATAAAAY